MKVTKVDTATLGDAQNHIECVDFKKAKQGTRVQVEVYPVGGAKVCYTLSSRSPIELSVIDEETA